MGGIDAGKSLALAGSMNKPLGWLLVLMIVPLIAVVVVLMVAGNHGARPNAAYLPALMLLAPATILLATMLVLRSLRRVGVFIDQGELVVNTGLTKKRRLRLSSLRAHGLETVDLYPRGQLQPVRKIWGTTLPGFFAGSFRLRNGEKAVCLLLDRSRVSYLRSDDDNLSLLLSLADPETLRTLLQR